MAATKESKTKLDDIGSGMAQDPSATEDRTAGDIDPTGQLMAEQMPTLRPPVFEPKVNEDGELDKDAKYPFEVSLQELALIKLIRKIRTGTIEQIDINQGLIVAMTTVRTKYPFDTPDCLRIAQMEEAGPFIR